MKKRVRVRLLTGATVFKLLFAGMLVSHVAGVLLAMAGVALGVLPLESSGGLAAKGENLTVLLVYLAAGGILVPMFSVLFWLSVWPGLWLYSKLAPLSVRYVAIEP